MVTQLQPPIQTDIIYPDSDGQPMADNTQQFELIVWIKENLELLFADNSDVFVAGDLLWYPVEGDNKLSQAPDVLVAVGRPKGYRGSYQQWLEDNVPPQVVFEIWSPGNRLAKMAKKFQFYERYGVEEYYLYNPERVDLTGWQRREARLEVIEQMAGWVSPRLGVRFELTELELQIYRPDGERFLTYLELNQQRQQERQRAEQAEVRAEQAEVQAEQERQRAEQERQRAEQAEVQAEQERQRAEQAEAQMKQERQRSLILAEQLRSMGIDPEQL